MPQHLREPENPKLPKTGQATSGGDGGTKDGIRLDDAKDGEDTLNNIRIDGRPIEDANGADGDSPKENRFTDQQDQDLDGPDAASRLA